VNRPHDDVDPRVDDVDDVEDVNDVDLDVDDEEGPSVDRPVGLATTVDDVTGTHSLVVPFDQRGRRVDAVVAALVPSLSRSRTAALIDAGCVTVDGQPKKASQKLRGGEVVVVVVPPPAPVDLVPEDLPLSIVFDDDDFCVVDKPAGLVVHPAPGHERGTLANALLFRFPRLSVGGERRPGIVHRLDKDTSGLIVVAKHDEALRSLSRQFAARTVDKRYTAVCAGVPGDVGVAFDVVTGHARAAGDRRRFTSRLPVPGDDSGRGGHRRAASRFCVRAARDGIAVVDVTLLTGRTHQIRVHLADRGHPLLQDALYGGGHAERRLKPGAVRDVVARLSRQALHAAALTIAHPRTGAPLSFASPLPGDLRAVVDAVVAT
jgi:23S rRNA pseudouridine1911/1915/1917 synthase